MSGKPFVLLVVVVLVLGGSLGAAFAGGVAVGKGQEVETPAENNLPQLPSNQTQQFPQFDPTQLSPEELDQFRQQFQGQFGQGGGGGGAGFGGRGGLTGTVEQVEGATLTVNTSQGPLTATLGVDTTIQMVVEGTLEDLAAGVRVTVTGQRGDDGTVQATTIFITPEGAEGLFGGGGRFPRGGQ